MLSELPQTSKIRFFLKLLVFFLFNLHLSNEKSSQHLAQPSFGEAETKTNEYEFNKPNFAKRFSEFGRIEPCVVQSSSTVTPLVHHKQTPSLSKSNPSQTPNWIAPKNHSAKCNIMLKKLRRGNKRSKSLPAKFKWDWFFISTRKIIHFHDNYLSHINIRN